MTIISTSQDREWTWSYCTSHVASSSSSLPSPNLSCSWVTEENPEICEAMLVHQLPLIKQPLDVWLHYLFLVPLYSIGIIFWNSTKKKVSDKIMSLPYFEFPFDACHRPPIMALCPPWKRPVSSICAQLERDYWAEECKAAKKSHWDDILLYEKFNNHNRENVLWGDHPFFKYGKCFLALGPSLCPYILDVPTKQGERFGLYK